jgi:hypothetical protein
MGRIQLTPTAPGHGGQAGEGVYLTKSTDPWPGLRRSSHTATKAKLPGQGDVDHVRKLRVGPRAHHDELLTCKYAMGRHSPESGTWLFPQVRTMGVQVRSRLRNDNSHRQPYRLADSV